jgi:Protein of unknown function (DUF3558)
MSVPGPDAAQIQQRNAELNQQAAAMQASAQNLKAAAGTGFHLEPEAAAILIKACQDSLHELEGLQLHLGDISQAPKLGQTPGAQVVAPFTRDVATDPQGMIPAINNLEKTLQAMIQAYRQASTNYQETEASLAQIAQAKAGHATVDAVTPAAGPQPRGLSGQPPTRAEESRRTTVLPLAVAALLGVAACTNSTTGNGSPAPTVGSTQSGGGSTSSGSGLTSIQPCDLLSSDILSQNQLGTPTTANEGGARTCHWQNTTASEGIGYAVGVGIRDSQGIKDVNPDGYTVTPDNIGGHPGRQLQSTLSGTCIIAIGVTNSSRVDVTVNAGTDPVQGCQLANQFAKLVEPNLPAASG